MDGDGYEAIREHVESFDADARDEFEERAAIMEFHVPGMSRGEAELAAYYRVCHRRGIEPALTRQIGLFGE